MTRGRALAVAAALLAVVVAVWSAVHRDRGATQASPSTAGSVSSAAVAKAAECRGITARVRSPAATTVTGNGARVAVLGDSYTSGYGLADRQDGYAYVLARALGWDAAVDGFPGSGFTTDAGCPGERYAERVDRIPTDVTLVLVEGGLNDVGHAAQVPGAAAALVNRIRTRAPAAAVVLVGPPVVPRGPAGLDRRVAADLGRVAAAHGATFVDATGWSLPYLPDGLHLTVAGHRTFAERISSRLAEASPVEVSPGSAPPAAPAG